MDATEMMKIVREVENKTNYGFDAEEISDVLAYTKRKCEINGKGETYVPILFENELRDYVSRLIVNHLGYLNRLKKEAMANV